MKYKRCCGSPRGAAETSASPGDAPGPGFHLIVETSSGLLIREVQAPLPLRADLDPGKAVEDATLGAAQLWGLPDFVFTPKEEKVGSGTRERGDGFIVVGDRGYVIQAKRRSIVPDSEERERGWLLKNIAKAIRQGRGTIRAMTDQPRELVNGRGRSVQISADALDWRIIVIIDHPDLPPGYKADTDAEGVPVTVLSRRDWDFLFDQLKSTVAVCDYLDRSESKSRVLDEETVHYFALANADAETTAANPRPAPEFGTLVSEPALPLEPVGAADLRPFQVMRGLLEDVGLTRLRRRGEFERIELLTHLDSLSVESRRLFGEFVIDNSDAVLKGDMDGASFRQRFTFDDDRLFQFGLMISSKGLDEGVDEFFQAWLEMRHLEHQESLGSSAVTTVGLLLTPRTSPARPYDTSVVVLDGELNLSTERMKVVREIWGERASVAKPIA